MNECCGSTSLIVSPEEAGTRLDRWLALKVPSLGRRHAQRWCDAGAVSVDGQTEKKSVVLHAGAQVCFPSLAPRLAMPNPALTLDVRFENQFLVIVSKPPGQASAPLDEHDNSALANALLAHYPSMQGVGHTPLEPGLVHRLDNGTSGLLVAARSQPVFDVLKQALSKGELEKQYLAVVQSSQLPDHGRIDLPLRPSPHNARRVVVAARTAPGARDAKTQYQVVARQPPFALIQVEACRALRHQIRAHLASVGCPLLNDELYGAERVASLAAGRHALHASRIAWCGNHGIPPFDIEEPLPGDLVNLLRELGFRENSASALNPLKTSGTNSRHER